ncbi:sugar-transfer associated ATP-grasp domain-containing protein [Robiginitalea aurantiaca]|uniref:Sugar-transfer associated ATP-grasp domain-containing protein n=1 Tax=Robiginitalea aurantiaca TaxID=3056915 RepID=A0ABT7WH27_9FLAO|nr:sugar-transfer associated ATP-grasp domain-containing protein [Robiginitalea aurantiaca]MDM9632224.1 sugar-transfer associated ATP-grasp domain-containing protein [Robiginitalea aurantiaca]
MGIRKFRIPGQPGRMKVFFHDPDKKPLLKCVQEFVSLSVRKKEPAYHYFKYIYKKQITNIHDYLSINERARIHSSAVLNRYEYSSILRNKLNFEIYFRDLGLRMPGFIGYNFKDHFYKNDNIERITTNEGLKKFFNEVLLDNKIESLFIRPIDSRGGEGCYKLNLETIGTDLELISDQIREGSHVFTEVIQQHKAINKIHSSSVNTIRLITLQSDIAETKIISAAIRFGVGDGIVDNLHSGGFMVGINIETGVLNKFGWLEERTANGEVITHHPDSGIRLGGFQIPYFKEACEMVLEATKFLPKTLIGWDVAIQNDGPIIVEGNDSPGLEVSDVACKGLLRDPYFKMLVEQVNAKN